MEPPAAESQAVDHHTGISSCRQGVTHLQEEITQRGDQLATGAPLLPSPGPPLIGLLVDHAPV